jgi:hypothetical protein
MASKARRQYRAYFMGRDGNSRPIKHPRRGGMLTYKEARLLAHRSSGCTTVGFFPKGSHVITTVWAKSTCNKKTRRRAAKGG